MMRRQVVLASGAFLLALSACDFGTLDSLSDEEAVEGSPEATAQALALLKFYESGDDDTIRRAIDDVEGVVTRLALPIPIQVKIGDLTATELTAVGKNTDPALPQGMLLVSDMDCSLAEVEQLIVAKNQTALYPGLYDAYSRTYTSNIQDYLQAKSPTVKWATEYTASAVERTYIAKLSGGARRVLDANPKGGPVILSRTVLDAPASFVKGSDAEFNQDYQIELFYEIAPRKVRHFYAIWREFRIGGLNSESDLYINLVLGNSRDFDVRTSKICQDKAPAATFN